MRHKILTTLIAIAVSMAATAQDFITVTGSGLPERSGDAIPIDQIDSITYDTYQIPMLPELMAKNERISLFCAAMMLTGANNLMYWFNDESYSISSDSTSWDNGRPYYIGGDYDIVAYPRDRRYYYTVFAETNDVFAAKGINNLDDLKAYAKQIYDAIYPEDANITDPTDRRNSLNRFVSYHILNRRVDYYGATAVDGANSTLATYFNRTLMDISDWYETMMPYSTMKFSFPNGSEEGLYINRRGVQDRADEQGVKIRGAKVIMPTDANYTDLNGHYYYVDDIVYYNQEVLGGELWRVDATTLSPDFMRPVSGGLARGHYTRSNIVGGKYGESSMSPDPAKNTRTCVGFKTDFIENFEFDGAFTHLHVRPRSLQFWSYAGDEVMIQGLYDVTIKLPPMPEGDYEIRQGICTGFENWGAVQYYLDGVSQSDFTPICMSGNSLMSGDLGRVTYDPKRYRYSQYNDLLLVFTQTQLVVIKNIQNEVNPETHIIEGRSYQIHMVLEDILIDAYQKREFNEASGYYMFGETTLTNHATGEAITMEQYSEWQNHAYEQAIDLFGKQLKADAKNWMAGPKEYSPGGGTPFSQLPNTIRRIVGRIHSDGHTDHYLRIRQLMGSSQSALPLDYLEFVPVSLLEKNTEE